MGEGIVRSSAHTQASCAWDSFRSHFVFIGIVAGLALLATTAADAAEWSPPADADLMSLEDLVFVEVTSVSKKAERASETAAAIFVIGSEDIRRSGAKSIPEALRLAPGLIVGQIDSNSWAISARGFNGQFADKLLVMMDGRTLYTPLFAGTYWDAQDYVMEDIDRIEVIRGPGATLWGANAVLGVINIITKNASDTQGGESVTLAGTERLSQSLRYGGKAGEDGHYRVYGKAFAQEGLPVVEDGDEIDDNWKGSLGFRTDFTPSENDAVTFSGDAYVGETDAEGSMLVGIHPTEYVPYSQEEEIKGANLLGRWDRKLGERSSLGLQSYIDFTQRNLINSEQDAFTFDVEFQHRISLVEHNELTWGVGYRRYSDEIGNSFSLAFMPSDRVLNTFSGFIQDEHRWLEEDLRLTVGTKLEHNDFTGFEWQPTVRLTYLFGKNTVWGAVSRTVQTRSRADDVEITLVTETSLLPVVYQGDPDSDAEEVMSLELGYRTEFLGKGSLDLATFYNDHQKQRDFIALLPVGYPAGQVPPDGLVIPYVGGDDGEAQTWGVELAMNWVAYDWWTLGGSYAYLNVEKEIPDVEGALVIPGSTPIPGDPHPEETNYPEHQVNLNSKMNLPHNLQFDTYLYWMDEVPNQGTDSSLRLDLRLGWKATENIDLSLVGQNLLIDEEKEWSAGLGTPAGLHGRSAYAKLTWKF